MLASPLFIAFVLVAAVGVSLWLCDRSAVARRISPLVLILSFTALCSNTGLIPTQSPLYGGVTGFCVPFAVCLVLFGVRLGELRALGKTMAAAFVVASLASVVGVLCASLCLAGPLEQGIGAENWKLAGPYAGTYVGGSLNFFALWEGLKIENPDLFAAANAVDNLTILPLMFVWSTAPSWVGRFFPAPKAWRSGQGSSRASETEECQVWKPADTAVLAACAVGVMALSEWVTQTLIAPHFPEVPSILVVTTLALGLGQLPFVARRHGAWDMGYLAFYLFFAAVGASIEVMTAIELSPILFAYVAIVFVVHMAILFGLGRLLKIDLGALIIASAATKGGPTLIPSVAQAHGWTALTLPGILLGLLGYAVGNYLGFGTAYAVRALL